MAGKTRVDGKVALAAVEVIALPRPNIQHMEISIIGTAPLISHAWSRKAKDMMLAKQMKKAITTKEAKDPQRDFEESLYTDEDGNYAMPSIMFKAAAVNACAQVPGITKTFARGAFHVEGQWVKIQGKPTMREDMVRLAMGVADIRYRGEYKEWRANIPVIYNAGVISREQILNLFQLAGFAIGVGEWRPERDGQYGTFRLAEDDE